MKISTSRLVLFLLVFSFAACKKIDLLEQEKLVHEVNFIDYEKGGNCFELIFPVSYTMSDGSTIMGDSDKEIDQAIKAWYETHLTSKEKPKLQYPVEVLFEEQDRSATINNGEEMEHAKEDCNKEWEEKDDCLELIFPVSYTMPDGSTSTGNDEEEIEIAFKAWYEIHPDSKEKPSLQYPVEVAFDGQNENLTINDDDEMRQLKEDCQ